MDAPLYNPVISVEGSMLRKFHILTNTCNCQSVLIIPILVGMKSHCSFNLCIPNDNDVDSASFHGPICHWCIFFGEMSIQIFYLFLKLVCHCLTELLSCLYMYVLYINSYQIYIFFQSVTCFIYIYNIWHPSFLALRPSWGLLFVGGPPTPNAGWW